jgi:hypothetical protein
MMKPAYSVDAIATLGDAEQPAPEAANASAGQFHRLLLNGVSSDGQTAGSGAGPAHTRPAESQGADSSLGHAPLSLRVSEEGAGVSTMTRGSSRDSFSEPVSSTTSLIGSGPTSGASSRRGSVLPRQRLHLDKTGESASTTTMHTKIFRRPTTQANEEIKRTSDKLLARSVFMLVLNYCC